MTLSCNATGKPTPNISWTKVEDNGTDSAPLLPAVDGKYVMSNIQRSANGTYRCTADNGVSAPVNRTVRVKVECKSRTFYVISKKRCKVVWKKNKGHAGTEISEKERVRKHDNNFTAFCTTVGYGEYFMESAGVRYLRTSC